jgi:5-methylcytosine-specific restriction protein A
MRSVPEWIGTTDDTPLPTRVKLRIWSRQAARCAACGRRCGIGGEKFAYDHVIALVNGGQNREANFRMICVECHAGKTREDVAEKATVYRKKVKDIGLYRSKHKMAGSKGSGIRKRMDGTIWRE